MKMYLRYQVFGFLIGAAICALVSLLAWLLIPASFCPASAWAWPLWVSFVGSFVLTGLFGLLLNRGF